MTHVKTQGLGFFPSPLLPPPQLNTIEIAIDPEQSLIIKIF